MNFKKHVLGALILSALTINANATGIEENTVELVPISKVLPLEIMPTLKVLPLNDMGKSFVFDSLEDKFDIQSQARPSITSNARPSISSNALQRQPSAMIADYDAVMLDAQYLNYEDKNINSSLREAYAQGKIIIIENGNNLVDNKIDQIFPIVVENDIVIIQPGIGSDTIYSYNTENLNNEVYPLQTITGDSDEISSRHQYNDNDSLYEVTLNSLGEEKRQELLSDVIQDLLSTKTPVSAIAKKSKESSDTNPVRALSSSSGGLASEVNCPSVFVASKECFVAYVNSSRYSYNGGGQDDVVHDVDGTNNIAVVMYKNKLGKYVMITNTGDVNARMTEDSTRKKGWFLDEFAMKYQIQSDKLFRVISKPVTENSESTITSSIGFSISATTPSDLDSLPTLSATYSETEGLIRTITDWSVIRDLQGDNDVKWVYGSNKPWGDNEWITDRPREKARLGNPNNISKFGLTFTTEGLWRANENTNDTIRIYVKREWITGYVNLYQQGNFKRTSNTRSYRVTSGEVLDANLVVRLAWLD
jgi:hypothetical protein